MRYTWIWLLGCCLYVLVGSLSHTTAQAQEATPITVDTPISSTLDAATPRRVYTFDGTRGAIVRLLLTVDSGDLDAVLTVFDADGTVLYRRDDTPDSRNLQTTLSLAQTNTYYISVARFGLGVGSTSGAYTLLLENIGVLSEQGSTLQYGVPVVNTIDQTTPQIYYTVQANAGDILNIEMVRSSGSLDPFLQLVDRERFLLAENDDARADTRNARIENLLVEESGTYIIVATRYGEAAGSSAGSFVLTVDEATNSGMGNSRRAPAYMVPGRAREADLTDSQYERFYRFDAERDQIVTIVMERTDGLLDTFVTLTNAGYEPLISDDDSGSGKNSRIDSYRIPADGIYHLIATRYEGAEGETEGSFRLEIIDEGNAFAGVPAEIPRLVYGTTVPDSITQDDSESLYAFWGTAGERVTVRMNRVDGTLNPLVEVLDDDRVRMVYNDDVTETNSNAAIESYALTYTGVHFIRATRYTGSGGDSTTTGAFNLTLLRDSS